MTEKQPKTLTQNLWPDLLPASSSTPSKLSILSMLVRVCRPVRTFSSTVPLLKCSTVLSAAGELSYLSYPQPLTEASSTRTHTPAFTPKRARKSG